MSQKSYTIGKESIRDLVTSFINSKWVGNIQNIEHIADMLTSLPEENVSTLITLILSKKEIKPLCLDDVVMYKPPSYSSTYDKDIMIDKGLMTKNGYIYGIVIGDTSWSSGDFNPYCVSMKVNIYTWKDNKIVFYEDSLKTLDLIKINLEDLPDFNSKEYLNFFKKDENKTIKESNTLNI
tara:strand:+ start:665 stop:1204 length:540 start_codon:yes stop_codon:yes gene_type:complete